MPMSFSYKKATQALNYFAGKNEGRLNKMKALKLVFFADRYHLRKYGRPITNDEYFAMNYGPVPSGVKDIAEGCDDFLAEVEKDYAARFIKPLDHKVFCSTAQPDLEVFSETDREALDFAWRTFGHLNQYDLADLTHQYPEWKCHEAAIVGGTSSRVKMSYSDFLNDPPSQMDPCHPLDEQERAIRREEIQELSQLHNLWN